LFKKLKPESLNEFIYTYPIRFQGIQYSEEVKDLALRSTVLVRNSTQEGLLELFSSQTPFLRVVRLRMSKHLPLHPLGSARKIICKHVVHVVGITRARSEWLIFLASSIAIPPSTPVWANLS
jgi:hypothetical protein